MTEYSFFERIGKIFEMIFSSSFFVALLIIIVLTIVILVINKKTDNLFAKIMAGLGYFLIALYIITRYGAYFFSLNDSFIDKVFSAMYFPNLITYICMLLISIFVLIICLLNKKYSFPFKIGNISCFSMIYFLLVLVLDTVKSNKIDVYDVKSIYSNETLMILLQASMYIFFIWMGILLINLVVNKITNKLDLNNEKDKIILLPSDQKFEDVKQLSDEEFNQGFNNNQQINGYNGMIQNNNNNYQKWHIATVNILQFFFS